MKSTPYGTRGASLRIGLIADEATRVSLKGECRVTDMTPFNYRLVLKWWRPDLVFVESAWEGRRNAWKYKIAAYPDHPERSNQSLVKLVACARELGIPCVFWNREDGVHFDRFIASASLFDCVFTVDVNCVERYRSRVGSRVVIEPLMFAVQPALHHPTGGGCKHRRACFLGSYSSHIHERRRQHQEMLFAACSEMGVTIFDRNSHRGSSRHRFPTMPGIEVRRSVAYDKTADIYRDYMVSLNVNTVEDSETMFSRRLVEIIACGGLAVTTPAKSVDKHFREYCHVVSTAEEGRDLMGRLRHGLRPQDVERARAGAEHVAQHHTWAQRLETILHAIK